MLVPPAGLKRKELFRGVATCFGPRAMSEVDSQKVAGPAAKNQSERPKLQFFSFDAQIDIRHSSITPSDYPMERRPLMGFVWWTGLDASVGVHVRVPHSEPKHINPEQRNELFRSDNPAPVSG